MKNQPTAIQIPDDWDDLTAEQREDAAGELLKALADQTGVDRGRAAEPAKGESRARPSRSFTKPTA